MLKTKSHTRRGHGDCCHRDEHHDCHCHDGRQAAHHNNSGEHGHDEHHHSGDHHGRRHHSKRLLRHGDLHLLVLSILSKQASYGYEIIKTINAASSGFYEPSPGTIYPTLTFLEERGFLASQMIEGSKKSYCMTSSGSDFLVSNADDEKRIWATLKQTEAAQKKNAFSEELEEAIRRFKLLLRHKLMMNELPPEKVKHIAEIINVATSQIEEVNSLLSTQEK